jgi:hypothetical protein
MKRGFLDLLDPSNDPEFFWQVISGPPCIRKNGTAVKNLQSFLKNVQVDSIYRVIHTVS